MFEFIFEKVGNILLGLVITAISMLIGAIVTSIVTPKLKEGRINELINRKRRLELKYDFKFPSDWEDKDELTMRFSLERKEKELKGK